MKIESIKQKISILSSGETTIDLLSTYLAADSNFLVETLSDEISLEMLLSSTADVLILDEENPLRMSTIDICKIVRTKNKEVVILLLTDNFDTATKILALEYGADDYLEKPVNQLEIIARIKATLRRVDFAGVALEDNEYRFNDLYLDVHRRVCIASEQEVKLTNYEFSTLLYLVQSEGRPVARNSLLNDIWGLPSDDPTRPVDDTVRRLRKKLRDQNSPTYISAVWGHGYRIEGE